MATRSGRKKTTAAPKDAWLELPRFRAALQTFWDDTYKTQCGMTSVETLGRLEAGPPDEAWAAWLEDDAHPVSAAVRVAGSVPLAESLAPWLARMQQTGGRDWDGPAVAAALVGRYLSRHFQSTALLREHMPALSEGAQAKVWAAIETLPRPLGAEPTPLQRGVASLYGGAPAATLCSALRAEVLAASGALMPLVAQLTDCICDLADMASVCSPVAAARARETSPASGGAPPSKLAQGGGSAPKPVQGGGDLPAQLPKAGGAALARGLVPKPDQPAHLPTEAEAAPARSLAPKPDLPAQLANPPEVLVVKDSLAPALPPPDLDCFMAELGPGPGLGPVPGPAPAPAPAPTPAPAPAPALMDVVSEEEDGEDMEEDLIKIEEDLPAAEAPALPTAEELRTVQTTKRDRRSIMEAIMATKYERRIGNVV
jgi:hypothetical protein